MKTLNHNKNQWMDTINEKFYNYTFSKEIKEILDLSSSLNEKIKTEKNKSDGLWEVITKKLKIDWTYHSNSIEGSTLTFGETLFFLNEGLTVEGKPFKDFLDAKNHAEAIDYLHDIVANNRPLSESIIKEINSLLLSGNNYTIARNSLGETVKKKLNAGEYKQHPNHVLKTDGSIHFYVEPIKVTEEIEELIAWVKKEMDNVHPIILSATAHYNLVRIHPFDDGNGRGARIIMNLLLMKKGFYPVVVKTERKRQYLNVLSEADQGNLNPFIEFIAHELIETYNAIISDLNI